MNSESLLFCVCRSQDDNVVERVFHPDGLTPNGEMTKPQKGVGKTMTEGVLSHHEVMYRLDCLEMERGKLFSPFSHSLRL